MAIPKILSLIKDDDPLVRAYAATSLADLKCFDCRARLAEAMKGNQPEAATAGILVALHLLGDASRFLDLLSLLVP